MDLDVVGHYARPDVFQLHVDERQKSPVTAHASEEIPAPDSVE
jgi:nitrilase